MSLVKAQLVAAIKEAFDSDSGVDVDPQEARNRQANKLATAFDNYVRSLEITYTAGLASPSGAVTGTFLYELS